MEKPEMVAGFLFALSRYVVIVAMDDKGDSRRLNANTRPHPVAGTCRSSQRPKVEVP